MISLMLCLSLAIGARAQFWSGGADPGGIRWNTLSTDNYKFIYPEGLDSLARVYGRYMEQYRIALALSSGLLPGQGYKSKTPVVLHAFSGESNGSVAWAPKVMEFYTLPDPYDPWPISWEKSLAIHESRHLAQMQAGYGKWFKPLYWLLGELIPGAYAGVYPGPHLLEGDAVVAETSLTATGRGRNADFLNYYMSAFDDGDWRDWYKWRYGSYKNYAPNHYALGYLTVAGARAFYDDPTFMNRYFESTIRHPLRLFHLKKTLRQDTGEKTLRGSGRAIMEKFHQMWNEEAQARAPFTPSVQVSADSDWFVSYEGGTQAEDGIYIKKSGKLCPPGIVKIGPDGKEEFIEPMSGSTGNLAYDPARRRIYWSETISDIRWDQAATSRIRFLDVDRGKMLDLTRKGRFYNPVPTPDGSMVCAVEYPYEGGTRAVLLDAASGETLSYMQAPDTLQFVQAIMTPDGMLAVCSVSDGGAALWKVLPGGGLETLLPTLPSSLEILENHGESILLRSDRSGVNEIYSLDPRSKELRRLTSVRYGSSEGFYYGNSLYYTSLTRKGRHIYKALSTDSVVVSPMEMHRYPVADKLSEQEKVLAGGSLPLRDTSTVTFTQAKRYRKLPSIFNVHSWILPVYINVDDVQQTAFDIVNGKASLGATAMFQNLLGTASGSIGWSWGAAEDGGRRHAGHFKLKYSGLYPVIEFSANVGERAAIQYQRQTYTARIDSDGKEDTWREDYVSMFYRNKVGFNTYLRMYVPLNFSSGAWNRGLIPQISYAASNDLYDKSEVTMSLDGSFGNKSYPVFSSYKESANVPMQVISTSVSGYLTKKYPSTLPYPKLGIGGEAGFRTRIALSELYPSAVYGYVYGYLPGFAANQGLRLSGMYQHLFDDITVFGENTVNNSPRGLASNSLASSLSSSSEQLKFTADYAIPLWFGDISVFSPVTYITHFKLKPHFDLSLFSLDKTFDGMLMSGGGDVTVNLANLLWIPYPVEIGVTFDYNFGPAFGRLQEFGVLNAKNHWHCGLVFNISI